jgi:hypothetical protein
VRLRWAIAVGVTVVVVLGCGVAYYFASSWPVELTRSEVVGTWVRDNGGPGVAVFREDGTVSLQNIPGGYPASGQGTWTLLEVAGPRVDITVGTTGFEFESDRDHSRTMLVTYTGDPDDPSSAHVFVRKNR